MHISSILQVHIPTHMSLVKGLDQHKHCRQYELTFGNIIEKVKPLCSEALLTILCHVKGNKDRQGRFFTLFFIMLSYDNFIKEPDVSLKQLWNLTKAGLLLSARVDLVVAVAVALWVGMEKGAPMERERGRGRGRSGTLEKAPMVYITGVSLLLGAVEVSMWWYPEWTPTFTVGFKGFRRK